MCIKGCTNFVVYGFSIKDLDCVHVTFKIDVRVNFPNRIHVGFTFICCLNEWNELEAYRTKMHQMNKVEEAFKLALSSVN